jgi:hypothetical protein
LIISFILLQNQFMANFHKLSASQVIRIILLLELIFMQSIQLRRCCCSALQHRILVQLIHFFLFLGYLLFILINFIG